ncbi:PREDICTED: 28S ribosomal protein S31, mitochondrial-like [Amphimedon queenslandica]|uniref:Small ribosomal subunit protein mS31 n=1 Tax=Amphimedon queenslandica TaxID=400682 RepID=A0A1X7UPT5_AMPQE|nr:PREDICTED: 28S ribosomal protein S31, mitochondrial-like [Amphimedon queenslandica]|eukprot:XP_011404308.1 PREDICTED: 28S ribosomal protein S31, mitochondrial-like [Amphimedon queenslandica]
MAALRQLQVLRLFRCYSSSRVYDKGPGKNYKRKLQRKRIPRVDLKASLLESLAKSEETGNEDTTTKETKNDRIQKTLQGLLSGLEMYSRPGENQQEEEEQDYDRSSHAPLSEYRRHDPFSDDRKRHTPQSDDRRHASQSDDRRRHALFSDDRRHTPLSDDRRRHTPLSDDRRHTPLSDDRRRSFAFRAPKPNFKLPLTKPPPVVTDPVNTSFTDGKRLGVFKIMTQEQSVQPPDPWTFREDQLKKEISFINQYKPLMNEFEQLMKDSPRVWKYPIDNQLPSDEDNVGFEDHVFLMKHIEDKDLPRKGPVRHFMELVATGLSMNPYYTAQEKVEHIGWYKDYFKQFPRDELDLE